MTHFPYMSNQALPPLTTNEFYVMLALHENPTHIYQLRARIYDLSLGSIAINAGNLYPIMTRLAEEGWVDTFGEESLGESGRIRRKYGLSDEGIIRLQEEFRRIKHAVMRAENTGLLEPQPLPAELRTLLLNVDQST